MATSTISRMLDKTDYRRCLPYSTDPRHVCHFTAVPFKPNPCLNAWLPDNGIHHHCLRFNLHDGRCVCPCGESPRTS